MNYTWGGSGTSDKPYTLGTEGHLLELSSEVYICDFDGIYFRLENDIVLQPEDWFPIGNSDKSFSGHFDGAGHQIAGIILDGKKNVNGFFGYLSRNAVVTALHLKGRMTVHQDDNCMGMLAGTSYGTIRGCQIDAEADMEIAGGPKNYTGGIAGINEGTIDGCKVTLAFDAKTSSPMLHSDAALVYVGGIASANYSKIEQCTACMTMDFTGIPRQMLCVGGLAAENQASINSCQISGVIKCQQTVFGLAEINTAAICSCKSTADLEVAANGGICSINPLADNADDTNTSESNIKIIFGSKAAKAVVKSKTTKNLILEYN